MAKAGYSCRTGAAISLTAATAKSILGVRGNAAFGVDLLAVGVSFNASGSSAPTNEPILVELMYATFATNPPGTSSTSVTPTQDYGRVLTHGFTTASNWTSEPTVLTAKDSWLIHGQTGIEQWLPLGMGLDSAFSEGFVLRCTAPNAVSARAKFKFERC